MGLRNILFYPVVALFFAPGCGGSSEGNGDQDPCPEPNICMNPVNCIGAGGQRVRPPPGSSSGEYVCSTQGEVCCGPTGFGDGDSGSAGESGSGSDSDPAAGSDAEPDTGSATDADEDSEEDTEPDTATETAPDAETVTLAGTVEKGPLAAGSVVTVTVLDMDLGATGQTFDAKTNGALGGYRIDVKPVGPLAIDSVGYYYNEMLGRESAAQIGLRAYFLPTQTGEHTVCVNVVTDLVSQRIRSLVAIGIDFAKAVVQAETELRDGLAITAPGFSGHTGGVRMSLTGGDTDANAYLLAVSAVVLQAALERVPGSIDNHVRDLLQELGDDLADDGKIDPEMQRELAVALDRMDIDRTTARLQSYLKEAGSTATVPDMRRVIDAS